MAPVEVIDLLSDSDNDIAAPSGKSMLAGFQPRKEKGNGVSMHDLADSTGSAALSPMLTNGQHNRDVPGAGRPVVSTEYGYRPDFQRQRKRSIVISQSFSTPADAIGNGANGANNAREAIRQERIQHFQQFHRHIPQSHLKQYDPYPSISASSALLINPRSMTGSALSQFSSAHDDTSGQHDAHFQQRSPELSISSHVDLSGPTTDLIQPRSACTVNVLNPLKRPVQAIGAGHTSQIKRAKTLPSETDLVLPQQPEKSVHVLAQSPSTTWQPGNIPPTSQNDAQQQTVPDQSSRDGQRYSHEEDMLLKKLKEEDGLPWDQIAPFFNGRTRGSLQVRYSTKLKNAVGNDNKIVKRKRASEPVVMDIYPALTLGRGKRERKSAVADGFVSWASINDKRIEEDVPRQYDRTAEHVSPDFQGDLLSNVLEDPFSQQDRTFPSSMAMILRRRELGITTRRAWSSEVAVTAELVNHTFKDYRIQKQYHGTSGDVVAMAWSPDASRFAAGSIAISDSTSQQYNMSRNLLLGDKHELVELSDHHIPRPDVDGQSCAMRESQDPRLFLTVTAAGFTGDSRRLFTAGTDKMLRLYRTDRPLGQVRCRSTIEHPAPVTLLSVHATGNVVATGCHSVSESIRVFSFGKTAKTTALQRKPKSQVPTFPTALKWGTAWPHRRLLLGGFSADSEKEHAGETCLWNVETQSVVELHAITRNVFDVAWNPAPSPASMAFVVASNPSSLNVGRGTRTAIQCFAPDQNEGRRVLIWECPAADINDVVVCPHDENLIAAGATNGRVYIWDYRYVAKSQQPLHTLEHGRTENVLDHDRDPEEADTGVRFLSWGRTKERLYSGSSDGIVKVWNPYRSPGNAFVDDIAASSRQRSAIMSGAFSADYRQILIGTENGRIDLFEAGGQAVYTVPVFQLRPTEKVEGRGDPYAGPRALLQSGQIQLRPAGAMPFRQAVQGAGYSGISLSNHLCRAAKAHGDAVGEVARAVDEEALTKATAAVEKSRLDLKDLEKRAEHFRSALPQAEAFQRTLARQELERETLLSRLPNKPEPCKLDCAVLRSQDDDNEVEDSGRSGLRIPERLRSVDQKAAEAANPIEEDDRCFTCCPKREHFGKSCASCSLIKQGLSAICSRCSGPARVSTDLEKPTVCEKCNFSCFRCGEPATLSPAMTQVTCAPCGDIWNVGALGYDFATPLTFRPKEAQLTFLKYERFDDFGDQEREHYAGLVEDTDV